MVSASVVVDAVVIRDGRPDRHDDHRPDPVAGRHRVPALGHPEMLLPQCTGI